MTFKNHNFKKDKGDNNCPMETKHSKKYNIKK